MNFLLILSFDGACYHGFQVQQNAQSVCAALQDGMEGLFGTRPPVKGASRTDAGVSARGYAASFKVETDLPTRKLPPALNAHLPRDIRVREAYRVQEDFHARYDAVGKEYEYRFLNAQTDDPLLFGRYHRVGPPLDEKMMEEAGRELLGEWDFSAFCAAGAKEGSRVRTLQELRVARQGEEVLLTARADGFLYNMMRILAGTLMEIGLGKKPPAAAREALESRQRQSAGPTLPAAGLCLNRVFYPPGRVPLWGAAGAKDTGRPLAGL